MSKFLTVMSGTFIILMPQGAAGPEGKREANSSPELSTKTVSSKCFPLDERKVAAASVSSRSGINSGPKGKKSVGDFVEKNKLIAHSVHSSINLSSGTGETRKRAAAAIQSRNGLSTFSTNKKSVGGMVEKKRIGSPLLKMSINLPSGAVMPNNTATAATKPRNGTNFIAKVIKSVGNSVGKRPTSRSLHMSINLPSGAAETSKTASVFDQNIIKKVHSNLPKNNPLAMRASTEVLTYPPFSCTYISISGFLSKYTTFEMVLWLLKIFPPSLGISWFARSRFCQSPFSEWKVFCLLCLPFLGYECSNIFLVSYGFSCVHLRNFH